MTVRAKFRVVSKTERESSRWVTQPDGTQKCEPSRIVDVKLSPVFTGSPENKAFYEASPAGEITLGCAIASAAEAFVIGQEYYVDFTRAVPQ